MKKITLFTILNLSVFTLFGQIFIEDIPHSVEPDEEAHFIPNANEQFQVKQAEKLKLDSAVFESYDAGLDQWDISGKYEYTYNEAEKISLRQYFTWDGYTQQWSPSIQYDYAHDNNGNRTLFMRSGWDNDAQQWIPSYKYDYIYDSENRLITRLYSSWDENTQQLTASSKREYTYDGNSENPALHQYFTWNDYNQEWLLRSQSEYTYDSNGNLTLQVYSSWDMFTQQWSVYTQYERSYDSENDLILYLNSDWNVYTQQWESDFKDEYTFDSNRNLTVRLNSVWNTNTQQWVDQLKYEYAYDNSYTSEDLIVHFAEPYTRHKITDYVRKSWDIYNQEWITDIQGTYHFSEQTVGITSATEAGIEIFPNPANDIITFNIENTNATTIQLYDAQGKYLHTQVLAQDNQLPVRHLDSGVYFYQLQYDGEIFGGKFMVK